ncbi:MAG: TrkA family potassium uptake protein [Ardenticatenaceae bacterium]|nr:TrkA family potassium uptake protein [Ardenticatenaceae bacterium]
MAGKHIPPLANCHLPPVTIPMKLPRSLSRNLRWRRFRASVRDTLLLVREFAWPLFLFSLAMIGGGFLYFSLAAPTPFAAANRAEAIYLIISLTFLQPLGDFPDVWYLEIFFFLMPIVGLSILAQGLADFGFLLFNRHARSKEWEMAVASTLNNHVVLIGLGHLGYRVARQLVEMDQDVAAIELNPKEDLITTTQAMGIPVIADDARNDKALTGAGVSKAKAIVLCTQNDSLNLQIALKARKMKPDIRVVMRIFDDEFAQMLEDQFGFKAMSATFMASPSFAAAAAGVDITRPITVEGEAFSLARLNVREKSGLIGRSMADIEQKYDLSVVLHRQNHDSDFHPSGEKVLQAGDVLAVLGGPEEIGRLLKDN